MNEPLPHGSGYRFLEWHYAPERRALRGPSGEVRLKPLTGRLLQQLLDAPGAVLAREHLIEQVWTRREVNDEVLSRAIAELRALLGDDARAPRFVETLSKGGYRWIAPVARGLTTSAHASDDAARTSGAADAMRRPLGPPAVVAIVVVMLFGAFVLLSHCSDDGATGQATLAVDLLGARPLSADPRLEVDARFDPGGRVVYIRVDQDSAVSELVMVDPVSMAERVLWEETHSLRHPAPSPDGREIAVTRHAGQACEIWSVAVIDMQRTRIGACAASIAGSLEWVDGGNALIHTDAAADAGHAPGLVLLDRRSGAQRVLTTPVAREGAHVDPRLSADRTRLVYASKHGNEGQLWQTDWPRMQRRTALLKRPEPIFGHAYDRGSDELWIAGDLTLYRALHRLRNGGEPELIGGRGARSIDLAADGSAVWSEAHYDGDIWIRASADDPWTAVARSNRYESQPEFSADGQRMALVSNRNGAESVVVFDRESGRVRQLVLDPTLRWVRPTWSARDASLILTAYEDRQTRLYRYSLDGDMPSVVPGVPPGAFHGTELRDRLLYLSGHGTEHSTLMQVRHGQATPENLDLGAITAYRASQDWLVWRREGSTTLHAAPFPALQPIREITMRDEDPYETFNVAGNQLAYVDQGTLWTLGLPDGPPVAVESEKLPNGSGPTLAIAQDGTLAIVVLTSLSIDLMIAMPSTIGTRSAREQ